MNELMVSVAAVCGSMVVVFVAFCTLMSRLQRKAR
jgi:hypothetical protein